MENRHLQQAWAEDRFDELLDKIKYIVARNQRPANQVFMDDSEAMEMLKICKRSLASLRADGIIRYHKVRGKLYYKLSDVLEMLENSVVVNPTESIRLFKKGNNMLKA